MKPLKMEVLVQPEVKETKTSTGIEVVSAKTVPFSKGKVLSIGKGVEEIKVGDRIGYSTSAYEELDDKHIVHESDVYVILEE